MSLNLSTISVRAKVYSSMEIWYRGGIGYNARLNKDIDEKL